MHRIAVMLLLGAGVALQLGCSAVMSRATGRVADNLSAALVDHNDPETVRQGAPAFLLLVDGLIEGDPDNSGLLLAGARLYGTYASVFVDDRERAAVLAERARAYGWQAACLEVPATCGVWDAPYGDFEAVIAAVPAKHIAALHGAAAAWATWIQANRSDWVAVADKARVEAMMARVVALDESWDRGSAHLFLGVLATLLPEAMGGKPEVGRRHFERAVELSGGRNLMAKVLFAREYARLVFDRSLHDRLCQEVIGADPVEEGMTLSNTLARQEAAALLRDGNDYFGE